MFTTQTKGLEVIRVRTEKWSNARLTMGENGIANREKKRIRENPGVLGAKKQKKHQMLEWGSETLKREEHLKGSTT